MNYKIKSFNYDNNYRGCVLSSDKDSWTYDSTTGVYLADLINCLNVIKRECVVNNIEVKPNNLIIEHSK